MDAILGNYSLRTVASSQADSMLAVAIEVGGPGRGFPAVLGASTRSPEKGVTDLAWSEVQSPGVIVCLVESPEELGDTDRLNRLSYDGEITFALWRDDRFNLELARIPWYRWNYIHTGSINPYNRVDPNTAGMIETDFESMRRRFRGAPFWTAKRVR